MNIVYFLCGIPCSGKTFFREANFTQDYNVISTDETIAKIASTFGLTYNDCFKDCIKFAEKRMYERLNKLLTESNLTNNYVRYPKVHIVWDQTNLTVASRKKKLDLFKDYSYRKIAYVFPTPDEVTLQERMLFREKLGKKIPQEVMASMIASFVHPSVEEGFDEVRYNYGGV